MSKLSQVTEQPPSKEVSIEADVKKVTDHNELTVDSIKLVEKNDAANEKAEVKTVERDITGIQPPAEIIGDEVMMAYWDRRYTLFSKFDEGIQLDRESWFSVTPEKIAAHIAERCRCDQIIDGFCGAGGNIIQFALVCKKVIGIDIDPKKLELARHNARIYGVEDRIEFIHGDFFQLATEGKLQADAIFFSPPWGGPAYIKSEQYDLESMLQPMPASQLMAHARMITPNVVLFLPRTSKPGQLIDLAGKGGSVMMEPSIIDEKVIALTAYYGDLAKRHN